MKVPLMITYLLNLFDLSFTMRMVNRFGIEVEGNPIGRWLIQSGSVYTVKIGAMAVALYALYRCTENIPKWKWICLIPLVIYSLLAIYHLFICYEGGFLWMS